MIKIWGRNTSSNVQKAMWAVGELKLEHQRIEIITNEVITQAEAG